MVYYILHYPGRATAAAMGTVQKHGDTGPGVLPEEKGEGLLVDLKVSKAAFSPFASDTPRYRYAPCFCRSGYTAAALPSVR
ncbi:hypothetical protein [Breznakiella homolactica]|uniref:Uncharacterized protein n=1 Tax=Breznakiella homolactica TaxID=2798577 RepID=A0A7T8B9U7_9SPIR|nr:hypothetical protein [Breznakiella homolactica]QQO08315.1 hypothetical protein JFL75_15455 [Breznakiella homolactica]